MEVILTGAVDTDDILLSGAGFLGLCFLNLTWLKSLGGFGFLLSEFVWSSGEDDLTTIHSRARAEVDDVIGRADDIQVMLDD